MEIDSEVIWLFDGSCFDSASIPETAANHISDHDLKMTPSSADAASEAIPRGRKFYPTED